MLVGWKPKSADAQIASVRFRCLTPMRTLQAQGFPIELFDPRHSANYDVVILSKLYDEAHLMLAQRLRANGQRVILDLSDNHFYNPGCVQSYIDAAKALDRMLGEVDLVTTCSDYLAEIVSKRPSCRSPVLVVEDAVEELDVVRGKPREKSTDRLRLFWFGSHGSPNAEAGISDLSELFKKIEGHNLPPFSLLTVMSNSRAAYERVSKSIGIPSRYLDWNEDQFCNQLSTTDVIVLPITPTPFSFSKSSNRVATALRYGIPVIADSIPAYEQFSDYAYVANWSRGFVDIIECAPKLVDRLEQGRAHVKARYNNDVIAQQWKSAVEAALGIRAYGADRDHPGASFSAAKEYSANEFPPTGSIRFHVYSTDQISQLKALPSRARLLGIPIERLISKLTIERGLSERATTGEHTEVCFIVTAGKSDFANIANTLKSIALQSHPFVRVVFFSEEITSAQFRASIKSAKNDLPWVLAGDSNELRKGIAGREMCVFLRSGDVADPSLASIAAAYSTSFDMVTFGHVSYSGDKCEIATQILNPIGATHDHIPIVKNAFALRGERVKTYPGDLQREFLFNELHLFQIWLRRRNKVKSIAHGEYLIFRRHTNSLTGNRWFHDYRPAYEELLSEGGKFRLVDHTLFDTSPFHIVPTKQASGASIIIPFRDKADMTLKSVASVARHSCGFPVEVILINNNSTDSSLQTVTAGLARIPDVRAQIINYPHPFNHSAQMNIGAKKASHEVLIFMNNDCVIESPGIFDDLCAWAIADGIGTVGVRINNPKSNNASLGIVKRLHRKGFYDSPVEEMVQPPEYQKFVRQVFGNTFAFAAMSKERYLGMKGLNELHFPVGYNDVEFSARCAAAGLINICLGHLAVSHLPGQSRTSTDESTQKMFARALLGDVIEGFREDYLCDDSLKGKPVYY